MPSLADKLGSGKTQSQTKKSNNNETPEETLKRLCTYRVNNVLDAIRLIGVLGQRDPSAEMTTKVFTAIRTAVTNAEELWKGKKSAKAGFTL